MIGKLSEKIAGRLLSAGNITEDDYEIYVYGLFMLISQIVFAVIACVFGALLRCFAASVIFYISFQLLRKYGGGFHASSEILCDILTTSALFICIFIIKLSQKHNFDAVLICCAVLCAVLIVILSPVDTPEKPLSEKERRHFRKISLIILGAVCTLSAVSYFFLKTAFAPLCVSIILEGILISAGKIKLCIKNSKT